MDKATAELRGTFKSARVGPDEEADGHNGRFQQNLWGSVPEAGLEKEQRTLLHLLSRESATAPTTLPTTTDGDALLGNGGPTHRLLLKIVSEGSEEEAKAVTLAVLRGGVVLRSMLGGEPVARALVKAVEGRVIENDATAAAILAARDAARGVSDTLTNDEQAALRAAESALGLPAGIAAGRERALAAKQKK
jgi:hypothetical protein